MSIIDVMTPGRKFTLEQVRQYVHANGIQPMKMDLTRRAGRTAFTMNETNTMEVEMVTTTFRLTKACREYHAPYGKTILTNTIRYLSYNGTTESIKRYDTTGYHTSRCHYSGSCGANHATLREAIRCVKSRVDAGLTWNS